MGDTRKRKRQMRSGRAVASRALLVLVVFCALAVLMPFTAAARPVVAAAEAARSVSPPPFTITPSAGAHGSITPPTPQTVFAGASVTFTIQAASGYHVADVLVDGASVGAVGTYTFADVQASHTISASFAEDEARTYTIIPSAGAHGSISPPVVQHVAAGGSVTFAIAAAAGYEIDRVLVDGVDVGTPSSYTFADVRADHTIQARFVADTVVRYTVTPSVEGTGSITPPTARSVSSGRSITFRMAPFSGNHLADVRVDGTSQGAPAAYTFSNVRAAHSIRALFEADPVLTVTSPAGGTFYQKSSVTVGFSLTSPVSTGSFRLMLKNATTGAWVAITPADSPIPVVAGKTAYTASWSVTQAVATYSLWVDYYAPGGDTPISSAQAAGPVTVAVLPIPGIFVSRPVSGETWYRNTLRTVAWTVTKEPTVGYFRVWATPTGGGTTKAVSTTQVPVVPGQSTYSLESTCTLPAGSWSVSVYYYDASGTFRSQNSVKPAITVVSAFTITSSLATVGGTITPLGQTLVLEGASQAFTMTPSAGYHVARLTVDGASAGAGSSYTFSNVTAEHSIAAGFERDPAFSITTPVTGTTWPSNASRTVGWTMSRTATVGSFRVWATPTAGGTTRAVSTTVVPVVTGRTEYSLSCTWTLPTGSWYLSVYYYDASGVYKGQSSVRPVVTVTGSYTITSTTTTGGTISPLGATVVAEGGSQTYTLTPSAGYHVAHLTVDGVDTGTGTSYTFSNVAANHTIAASFERDQAIVVTAPLTGTTWPQATVQTVSWKANLNPTSGTFRVWATPQAGGTTRAVSTTVVPVVSGQSSYSLDCTWTLPSGTWLLSVYYYDSSGVFKAQNTVKPVITVP